MRICSLWPVYSQITTQKILVRFRPGHKSLRHSIVSCELEAAFLSSRAVKSKDQMFEITTQLWQSEVRDSVLEHQVHQIRVMESGTAFFPLEAIGRRLLKNRG